MALFDNSSEFTTMMTSSDVITNSTTRGLHVETTEETTSLGGRLEVVDNLTKILYFSSRTPFWNCPESFWMIVAGMSIMYVIGVIGNGLCLTIMTKPHMRSSSNCNYLAAISVADLIYSTLGTVWMVVLVASRGTLELRTYLSCEAFQLLWLASATASSHFMVAFSIERCLAIFFPFRNAVWVTARRTRLIILCIVLYVTVFYSSVPFFYHSYTYTQDNRTLYGCTAASAPGWWLKTHVLLDSLMYTYGPLSIITLANVLIVIKLIRGVPKNLGASVNTYRQNIRTIPLLLGASVLFICTTGPFVLMTLLRDLDSTIPTVSMGDKTLCSTFLFWASLWVLNLGNNSLNFYVYCLTGKKFRNEVVQLLCRRATGMAAAHSSEFSSSYASKKEFNEARSISTLFSPSLDNLATDQMDDTMETTNGNI